MRVFGLSGMDAELIDDLNSGCVLSNDGFAKVILSDQVPA